MRTIGRKVIKEIATTDQTKLAGCSVQTRKISTEGVRIQSMNGSFANLLPLPAIRVLYVTGVKGPIKVLCMQDEVILRPMDLIIYLEVRTVFATENQNHTPIFGSDGTLLQNHHGKSIILRDNPKRPGIFSTLKDPEQFWIQTGRPI